MPAPYSHDLRRKIIEAHAKGRSQTHLAADFGVSEGFVSLLLKRWRTTGSSAPRPHGGGRRPSLDAQGQKALSEMVKATPDATLAELRLSVRERLRVAMSIAAVDRALAKLDLPRKKSRSMPRSATPRASKG